jgi:site-specific DNA recombinase
LIFDDRGNRMSPSYTVRRGNRYRYYIAQAALRGRGQKPGSRTCVGADDIETLVLDTLAQALGRPGQANRASTGSWDAETRTFVQDSVERVVVGSTEVEIVLKAVTGCATAAARGGVAAEYHNGPGGQTVLKAGLPAARPRSRKEIVLPGVAAASSPRHVDEALILALARARSWMRALRAGEHTDTAEIARRCNLSDAHVRRLLRLAYLAPGIVEASSKDVSPAISRSSGCWLAFHSPGRISALHSDSTYKDMLIAG